MRADLQEAKYLCPHAARRERTLAKTQRDHDRRVKDRARVYEGRSEAVAVGCGGDDCSMSCPCGQYDASDVQRPWLTTQVDWSLRGIERVTVGETAPRRGDDRHRSHPPQR